MKSANDILNTKIEMHHSVSVTCHLHQLVISNAKWDNFVFLKEMDVTIQGLEGGLVDQSSGGQLSKDHNVF
jgi:hypothetical protein